MNWILDTYSNVYSAAMMQPNEAAHHVAVAKDRVPAAKRTGLFGLLKRR
jgi:hypothetical protein